MVKPPPSHGQTTAIPWSSLSIPKSNTLDTDLEIRASVSSSYNHRHDVVSLYSYSLYPLFDHHLLLPRPIRRVCQEDKDAFELLWNLYLYIKLLTDFSLRLEDRSAQHIY